MSTRFSEARVVKELKIEVNKKLEVRGFIDLVQKGRIKLKGTLERFNEKYPKEIKLNETPLIIHLKFNKTINPNEPIGNPFSKWSDSRTAKELVQILDNFQVVKSLRVFKSANNIFLIECFTQPYGDLNLSIYNDTANIKILEAKNVPEF